MFYIAPIRCYIVFMDKKPIFTYRKSLYFQLMGWILFLICAVLFTVSGIKSADGLVLAGSLVFLIACVFFIIPLVAELRDGKDRRG